jgi:uncharacterized protein YndB with AHSA1/START domain
VSPENDDKRLVIRKRIEATREELFDAWTDPESMQEWMCPGDIESAEVEMEARVGGKLLIVMKGPTESHEHRGEVTIVERPSKLAFSWTGKGTDWRLTLVTVEFFEVSENETELVLTHENFPSKEVRDRHQGGWSKIVTLLEQHIRRRAS